MSARRSLSLADPAITKADERKVPPAKRSDGNQKVNVGQAGETVKQVVVFSDDQPVESGPISARVRGLDPLTDRSPSDDNNSQTPRRSSLKPVVSPTAVVPRGGFDVSPSFSAAAAMSTAATAQWQKFLSKELPEGTARLLPYYDVSLAAGNSCARAAELLELLGRAWPHDYAVCFSGSTRSFWLLIRVGKQLDVAEVIRSHQLFASVMQSLIRDAQPQRIISAHF
eukprot:GGOE01003510.1.p1 GENE.GGOE01003510.1~~GGOE01003510.1.p1  ORF type:complete len:234 (+),score=46.27 GGOE01003510.1:26-703(+)